MRLIRPMATAGAAVLLCAGLTACSQARGSQGTEAGEPAALPVVRTQDAKHPVAGRDYTLLHTFGADLAERAHSVADSGEIFVWGTRNGTDVLFDPVTRKRTPLPPGELIRATRQRAMTTERARSTDITTVQLLDRRTGRTRSVEIAPVDGSYLYPVGVADGRVWWFRSEGVESRTIRLSSTPVGAGGSARAEGTFSGAAVGGDLLATLGATAPRTVRLRDLASGEDTSVRLPTGCAPLPGSTGPVHTNGTEVTVDVYCSGRGNTTYLLDTSGLLAELRVEGDEGVVAMSERTVSFFGYVYDLTRHRLLDVSGHALLSEPAPSQGPGEHPVGLWPRWPKGAQHPSESWVVRLR